MARILLTICLCAVIGFSSRYALCEQKVLSIAPGIDLTFVPILGGPVTLGDRDGQADERPLVEVHVDSFYLQQAEVTRALFQAFVRSNPAFRSAECWVYQGAWVKSETASWLDPGYRQESNHPVVCISWQDVQLFIKWINTTTGYKFRLPTEAEWEYAARAGSQDRYHWGSDPSGLCKYANASDAQTLKRFPSFKSNKCDDGYLETAPIKQYLPNLYGIYDIYGNVWEWVQDCWNDHYRDMPKTGKARLHGDCQRRVFRGGGWGDNPNFARSGLRNRGNHYRGKDDVGFRLAHDWRFTVETSALP